MLSWTNSRSPSNIIRDYGVLLRHGRTLNKIWYLGALAMIQRQNYWKRWLKRFLKAAGDLPLGLSVYSTRINLYSRKRSSGKAFIKMLLAKPYKSGISSGHLSVNRQKADRDIIRICIRYDRKKLKEEGIWLCIYGYVSIFQRELTEVCCDCLFATFENLYINTY